MSRAITPEEYNAAVAQTPEDCPLFAAGDLRSGRQVCVCARACACVCVCACVSQQGRIIPDASCLPLMPIQ